MVARAVRQRVHDSRDLAADPRPIVSARPAQAGGVGNRGHVQDQVGRSAERGMRHHRVLDRGIREDVTHRDPALLQADEREGGAARHVEPDRVPGRRQGGMPQRHAKRFADDLCGRGGPEELAAAAGRCARAAPGLGGLFERELAVCEADTNRLHPTGVFAVRCRQRDAARHEHARKIATAGERHHHRGQALVAGGDAEHATPRRQRPDQPAEDRRCVVPIRQAVEHCRRPLRTAVARVGARAGKRDRPGGCERCRCGFHQQPDLPVAGVIAERDRRPVGSADAAVGGQHQEFAGAELRRIPAHAGVLRPAEQIARRTGAEHLRGEREYANRAGRAGRYVECGAVVGVEGVRGHGLHQVR